MSLKNLGDKKERDTNLKKICLLKLILILVSLVIFWVVLLITELF